MCCTVCLSLVWEPVTPPCCHSACFACLERVVASEPIPKCPTCRAPITSLPASWTVNRELCTILELNAGPAYRKRAGTHQLHNALRAGDSAAALATLGVRVDPSCPVVHTGASWPVLDFVLQRAGQVADDAKRRQWLEVAVKLVHAGAGMDEGVGILNLIPAAGGFELLRIALDKGAKNQQSQ